MHKPYQDNFVASALLPALTIFQNENIKIPDRLEPKGLSIKSSFIYFLGPRDLRIHDPDDGFTFEEGRVLACML